MKRLFSIGLSLLLVLSLSFPASAAPRTLYDTMAPFVYKVCSADKCTYNSTSIAWVNPDDHLTGSYVGAIVQVASSDYSGKNVPAGYMGGEPRLYVNNILRLAGGWSYNSGRGNAMQASTGVFDVLLDPREGIIYSKSKFGLYNGNGYDIYDTNRTPSLDVANYSPQFKSSESLPEGTLDINSAGQTYGAGWLNPDLIEAIGVDGVHGYVLDAELTSIGMKSSPDDIVTDIPETIPLYAQDGVTVVGEFLITPSTSFAIDY